MPLSSHTTVLREKTASVALEMPRGQLVLDQEEDDGSSTHESEDLLMAERCGSKADPTFNPCDAVMVRVFR